MENLARVWLLTHYIKTSKWSQIHSAIWSAFKRAVLRKEYLQSMVYIKSIYFEDINTFEFGIR